MWMYSVAVPTLQSLPCTIALSPVWPFKREPIRTPLHENKALQYTMCQMLHKKDTTCNGCEYMLLLISKKTTDKIGNCIKNNYAFSSAVARFSKFSHVELVNSVK